jgi:hypothetical protein
MYRSWPVRVEHRWNGLKPASCRILSPPWRCCRSPLKRGRRSTGCTWSGTRPPWPRRRTRAPSSGRWPPAARAEQDTRCSGRFVLDGGDGGPGDSLGRLGGVHRTAGETVAQGVGDAVAGRLLAEGAVLEAAAPRKPGSVVMTFSTSSRCPASLSLLSPPRSCLRPAPLLSPPRSAPLRPAPLRPAPRGSPAPAPTRDRPRQPGEVPVGGSAHACGSVGRDTRRLAPTYLFQRSFDGIVQSEKPYPVSRSPGVSHAR